MTLHVTHTGDGVTLRDNPCCPLAPSTLGEPMSKRTVLFIGGPLNGVTEKLDEFQLSRTVWAEVPDHSDAPREHERFHYRITDGDGQAVGRLTKDWDAQEYEEPVYPGPDDPGYTPEWLRP